jgi:orotidine-5'-phosphate decarboxylase
LPVTTERHFGARLVDAMAERGPLCVGIDPHPSLLAAWGLPDSVAGLETFALTAVQALAGEVAVIKPQSAFYEAYGSAGIAVLERVIGESQAAGALVLLDVKRGDIGSTMQAYARAYLADGAPLAADAITVSPYLGFGSLRPALELAAATGRGVFVLGVTSNPEAPQVQQAQGADGRLVAQTVVDQVAELNADVTPLGSFGLVVGATVGDNPVDLSTVNGPLLAPGLGAQGGTAKDLRKIFGDALRAVLPSSSREILAAGPDLESLRAAALWQRDELAAVFDVAAHA